MVIIVVARKSERYCYIFIIYLKAKHFVSCIRKKFKKRLIVVVPFMNISICPFHNNVFSIVVSLYSRQFSSKIKFSFPNLKYNILQNIC